MNAAPAVSAAEVVYRSPPGRPCATLRVMPPEAHRSPPGSSMLAPPVAFAAPGRRWGSIRRLLRDVGTCGRRDVDQCCASLAPGCARHSGLLTPPESTHPAPGSVVQGLRAGVGAARIETAPGRRSPRTKRGCRRPSAMRPHRRGECRASMEARPGRLVPWVRVGGRFWYFDTQLRRGYFTPRRLGVAPQPRFGGPGPAG